MPRRRNEPGNRRQGQRLGHAGSKRSQRPTEGPDPSNREAGADAESLKKKVTVFGIDVSAQVLAGVIVLLLGGFAGAVVSSGGDGDPEGRPSK